MRNEVVDRPARVVSGLTVEPSRPLVGRGIHLPALDGLRGLAVIAVVLYHLWPEQVPGGWLGVGLFFTLSGFLVIGLVVDEVDEGGLDYRRFYRRRVRRLLPAALLTIVTVVVWAAISDESIRRSVATDGLWAALNLANWNQMADAGGYAAIFEQSARPLGHMWSLAIEEQFYLTAPLLIGLTRRPAAMVGAGLVLALIAHVVWWGSADAYLATPVRIAEILVGGALAIALRRNRDLVRIGRLWPLALVAGVVAVAMVGESEAIVTRGFPAAMALVWTVLVAAALVPGWYARALCAGWLRWVGLRSYAIYLFHWPLIELTDWNGPTVIVVTLLLAELSFRFVEDPVRHGLAIARPVVTLVGASAAVALVLALAVPHLEEETFLVEAGFADELPEWFTADVSGAVEESGAAETTAPATGATVVPDRSVPVAPATGPPVVVVLGDSTATQVVAGLRSHADETRSLAVVDRSTSGCSALIDELAPWRTYKLSYGYLGEFAFEEPCRVGLDATGVSADIALIVDHGSVMADHQRPDGTWASIVDADVRDDLRRIYRARIAEARAQGTVLALTTAPRMVDVAGLLGDMDDLARLEAYNRLVRELATTEPGVRLLELGAALDRDGIEGRFSRPDGLHLDEAGARRLAEEILAPTLMELVTRETA